MAKKQLYIFFVGIVNNFDIKLDNDDNEKPSTAYKPGLNLSPRPFKVRFVTRWHFINLDDCFKKAKPFLDVFLKL